MSVQFLILAIPSHQPQEDRLTLLTI